MKPSASGSINGKQRIALEIPSSIVTGKPVLSFGKNANASVKNNSTVR
jgi:hypothetical protein